MGIESFLDREKHVENFFGYMNTPDHKKVKLVALKLKSGAPVGSIKGQSTRYGKHPIWTWEKMKNLIRERFLLVNYEQILYDQYYTCRQGSRSISD